MTGPYALELSWPDGREETVSTDGDATVLEAAESAGVALPFGCRTGACGSCAGRKTDGRVSYVRPPRALKPHHHEAGYMLCCIARARSDLRIAVGSSVRAELVSNPWK